MCKKYYNINILALKLLKSGGYSMAIKSYSAEFNFVLILDKDKIFFKDLEQFENKTFKVEVEEAEQLQRITRLSVVDAAAILGKIEQIRVCSAARRNNRPRKIDPVKLNQTLAIILLQEDWRELFINLQETKYHQIVELCESRSPLSYYQRFM